MEQVGLCNGYGVHCSGCAACQSDAAAVIPAQYPEGMGRALESILRMIERRRPPSGALPDGLQDAHDKINEMLGRPQMAAQPRHGRTYVSDLEDTLDQIATMVGSEPHNPEALIKRIGMLSRPDSPDGSSPGHLESVLSSRVDAFVGDTKDEILAVHRSALRGLIPAIEAMSVRGIEEGDFATMFTSLLTEFDRNRTALGIVAEQPGPASAAQATDDRLAAVQFYAANPGAALFDLKCRIRGADRTANKGELT